MRVGTAYLVVGWLFLQLIDVVFPMFGLDESLGRPILILLLFGLPIVLILTWLFELMPEGIKREKDIDRSQSPAGQKDRLLDRAIIAILIFTIGLLLIDKFVLQQQSAPQQPVVEVASLNSVAVLPFVNLSGKKENEYFSDGLTETLLHMLAQLPNLKVAARTSAFSFKDKKVDVREIARSLGIATILEGSVQRSGEKLRITAQLIEAETGFHLWSQTFDRNLDDIFLVQDEFALKGLDQPLGKQLGWNLIYQHVAWMKPLLNDPRLVNRIVELEAETLAAGDEVRAMLMEKRAGTG